MTTKCRLQGVYRFGIAVLVAQNAGQVVRAVGNLRMGVAEIGEQFGRNILLVQAVGQPSDVVGDLALVGQLGQGCFITGDGGGEVAQLFARYAQQPPGDAVLFVALQRLYGPLTGADGGINFDDEFVCDREPLRLP